MLSICTKKFAMTHQEFVPNPEIHLHIMLADGDRHHHFFFDKVLKTLCHHLQLTTVEDGLTLMNWLFNNDEKLPDVLLLDYNMPGKNGFECLLEIKQSPKLKSLPVMIYSADLYDDIADLFYESGAYFYIPKMELPELKKVLHYVFVLLSERKLIRPAREQFMLTSVECVTIKELK